MRATAPWNLQFRGYIVGFPIRLIQAQQLEAYLIPLVTVGLSWISEHLFTDWKSCDLDSGMQIPKSRDIKKPEVKTLPADKDSIFLT